MQASSKPVDEFSLYVRNLDISTPVTELEELLYELFLQVHIHVYVCLCARAHVCPSVAAVILSGRYPSPPPQHAHVHIGGTTV